MPSKKPSITAVVITKDEEHILEGCLRSLAFCDQLVVIVDDRSKDKTEEIARRFTKDVWVRKFDNFADQKNYGFEKATSEWILSIDSDERVNAELRQEIIDATTKELWGYTIPTKPYIFGIEVKHGGWWQSEHHLRLFRSNGRYRGEVHEVIEPLGPVTSLTHQVVHFNYNNVSHFITKLNVYTDLEAKKLQQAGVTFRTRYLITKPFREFLFCYIKQRGYKDGFIGLALALLMACYRLVSYLKLWEEERNLNVEQYYQEIDHELK